MSVVGTDKEIVYEKLIKPDNPIMDYNTQYVVYLSNAYYNTVCTTCLLHSKLYIYLYLILLYLFRAFCDTE